jgi:hypothetical protein
MSMGSRLNAIEETLIRLQARAMRHPAFVRGTNSMPDDPAHHRDAAELTVLQERLALLIRELRNDLHLITLHEQIAKRQPREFRFRAMQSVGDRRAAVTRVYERAVNLLAILDESGSRPPVGEIVGMLLEKGTDVAKEMAALIKKDASHYPNLFLNAPTVQNVPLVFVLAVLLAYLWRGRTGRTPLPHAP